MIDLASGSGPVLNLAFLSLQTVTILARHLRWGASLVRGALGE